MQVFYSGVSNEGRDHIALGQLRATTGWRAADRPVSQLDREIALRALVREAEDSGADALMNVDFAVERLGSSDIDCVPLMRVAAVGTAVRLAIAA